VPLSKVGRVDITPAAWFPYPFEEIVQHYNARPKLDRVGGGAGPVRFFILKLSHGRFACFSSWERKKSWETEEGEHVELSLKVNERGVVYWEDFEEVMDPFNITLDRVRLQGAWNWRRRRAPTDGARIRWRL